MKIVKWLRGLIRRDDSGVDAEDSRYPEDEATGARLDSLGGIGVGGNVDSRGAIGVGGYPPVMPQDDHPRH